MEQMAVLIKEYVERTKSGKAGLGWEKEKKAGRGLRRIGGVLLKIDGKSRVRAVL